MRAASSMVVSCLCLAFVAGCGDGGTVASDSGRGAADAGTRDAASEDGGSGDAGSGDASSGNDAATADDAAVADDAATAADAGGPVAFTLTSSAYVEGGVIPLTHACTDQGGDNHSPPLAWVGAPAGTLSYAVFLTDITTNFRHSAIYDIPAVLTGLPEDVDHTAMPLDVPGARQPRGYPGTPGYAGPCPGSMHSYRFTLYAIDVATLPGLTASSSLASVESAMMAHSLGTATLTGTYTPPPP